MKCPSCNHQWYLDEDSFVDADIVLEPPLMRTDTIELTGKCTRCSALAHKQIEFRELILKVF